MIYVLTLRARVYLKTRTHYGGVNFKISKFAKNVFFCEIHLYSVKIFAKKCLKNNKIYIFEKPLSSDHAISNMQKILQTFKQPGV